MEKKTVSMVDDSRHPIWTIVMLAWPILLEQVLVSLVQAVDTAMVGSLGANATASVAISHSPNMLINGVIMALGVGFTSLIARSVGAGNLTRAKLLVRQSILVVFAICIPMTAVMYSLARLIPLWMGGAPDILDTAATYNKILALSLLFRGITIILTAIYRGYGDSKTPMVINILVNLINVVCNYFMIYPSRTIMFLGASIPMFGLGWGVAGAAVATSLSGVFGGLALLVLTFVRKTELQISLRDGFAPSKRELSSVIRISLPAMLERFTMSGAFILIASTVASLGTAAVAAQNLAATAESLSFMPGFAFGTAVTTLFGQSLGAKRTDLAARYVTLTIRIGSFVMFFMSLLLFFAAVPIMGLFTPDEEVIRMGSELLRILAIIQVPQMIAMVYSGALKGSGDTKSPFLIALISMWGVRLLGAMICVHVLGLGLTSVCICMCTDNVVRCLLFYLRYHQNRWMELED